MHRLVPLLLALALVSVGCLDGAGDRSGDHASPTITGQPSDEARGPDEYWMVWVDGDQRRDPPPGYVCSIVFDHTVDADNQTVAYSNDTYAFYPDEVAYLVAFDLWEQVSSCPKAYSLHTGHQALTERMGAYGNLTLDPAPNGSILLEPGTWLHPGQQASYTYQATERSGGQSRDVTGWFNVTHLGAWPQDGLAAR